MTPLQVIRKSSKNIALILSFIFGISSFGFGNILYESVQTDNFTPPEKKANHIKIGL